MNSFEEKLRKLEDLTSDIKRTDISLEDALKDFEEGIKLAKGMQKELDAIEGKVQILTNAPVTEDALEESSEPKKKSSRKALNEPVLDLFNSSEEINGTRA